jgi:organic hydroperoxide reductase OsmC/OhrA
VFRGERNKHNPEDLLLAALSSCHMLSYLALCARNKVSVLLHEKAHATCFIASSVNFPVRHEAIVTAKG